MKLFITVLVLVSAAFAQAEDYTAPIVRDGVKKTRTVYDFWSGEWPGPVIRVNSTSPGTTTIAAYTELRKKSQAVTCTIQNGVYHPWSVTAGSIITYYTVSALNNYKAQKDVTLENSAYTATELNVTIKKGDSLNVIYGGEGYCVATYKKEQVGFSCEEVYGNPSFKRTSPEDEFYEQWLYLDCAEGYKAFVQDEALLGQPGMSTGDFPAYGEVN